MILRDVYNVKIPRTSQQQFDASTKIEKENLKEGDLVFFNTVSASMIITHVGCVMFAIINLYTLLHQKG